MSVLTFKSEEFKTFPAVLRSYASYLNSVKGTSEKTVCEYLLDLRTFFRFLKTKDEGLELSADEMTEISILDLTIERINKITENDINSFLEYTGFNRENTNTTKARKLSSLRSFFKYAYGKKKLIDSNPLEEIDSPKKGKALPKYLSVEEAIALLTTVKSDTSSPTRARDYAIISLFLNTGMRLSELVGLNLESFDRDLTQVKVLGKGNKERLIYLNEAAREALKEHLSSRLDPRYVRTGDHALFISRLEKRISNKTVQWVIYKYLNLAGLGYKGLSVHKLRHTAATLMYQSGQVDIRVLKDILGHEQLNTTQIYTHLIDQNMQDAVKSNPLANLKIETSQEKF